MTTAKKILIIEDGKDLRDDVIEMLSLEGYEAFGAENGLVGLNMAIQETPDLIICDVMMPELDGYEVLERLRKNPKTATIPFVFLTSRTERVNMRQGMVLGADDYLTKPFHVSELLDTIQSQLGKRAELNAVAQRRLDELRESITISLPHEMRTPLNTIIGFSDMLIAEAQRLKPDQVIEWATHINKAANRLFRIVENYLIYARVALINSDPQDLEDYRQHTMRDLGMLLRLVGERVAERYERMQDLHIVIAEDAAECEVCASYIDVQKAVDEVLDNAFKFSEAGQPVNVRMSLRDGRCVISVQDEGRGITPEQIAEIGAYRQFDRDFYEQQGLGLGLTIAMQLLKLYDAELSFVKGTSCGTTVEMSFRTV